MTEISSDISPWEEGGEEWGRPCRKFFPGPLKRVCWDCEHMRVWRMPSRHCMKHPDKHIQGDGADEDSETTACPDFTVAVEFLNGGVSVCDERRME